MFALLMPNPNPWFDLCSSLRPDTRELKPGGLECGYDHDKTRVP